MGRLLVKTKNNISTITTLGLVAVTSFIGFNLAAPQSSATSASVNASVTVPDACTLASTLNTPHTATLSPGTSTGYGNAGGTGGIGQTTLKVTCNDAAGFAIYAIGYTEETYGNNTLVSNTKNNGVSAYTISTGTNTSGANSNWAMQINAVSGTFAPTIQNSFDSSSYHNVPSTYIMVAKRTSSTMDPADSSTMNVGSSITTTYAAYISSSQAPDTYTGKVKYTMVHPNNANSPVKPLAPSDCSANSICYAPNADDIVGSMRSLGSVSASSTAGRHSASANSKVTLRAYNYSRSGYGFAGWSPSYEASIASGSTDIIYGPQATISTNPSDPEGADVSTNGLILYPVWVASAGTMQAFSSSDCNSMNVGDVTARTDVRDNNTYAIAKLVDNKCWMIENLRLNNTANITTANTQSNNGAWGGVFAGLAESEDSNFSNVNPTAADNGTNSLYSSDGSTPINIGTTGVPTYRMPRYNNSNIDRSLTANYSGSGRKQWYSYGNYYTWPAAVADTDRYISANVTVNNTSLCPTGWKLPRGGDTNNNTNNDFRILIVDGLNGGEQTITTETRNKLRDFPNNFLYSGMYQGSSPSNRGSRSYYWTSTANNSDNGAYVLNIQSEQVNLVGYTISRNGGSSIRCIAGT